MIDDIELREISVETGVPVGTIEKDLAITCILLAISTNRLRAHLAFKGGTAIKKAYYPESQFSENLDFTAINLDEKEATRLLKTLSNTEVNSITFGEIYNTRTLTPRQEFQELYDKMRKEMEELGLEFGA